MTPELLNKLKRLANIAAHLPHDVTLEDEDAAMKALHGELAADTVLQMIALAERALLAAAPAPIQRGHDSDCAVNNAPAMPVGPCNCSLRAWEWAPNVKLADDEVMFFSSIYQTSEGLPVMTDCDEHGAWNVAIIFKRRADGVDYRHPVRIIPVDEPANPARVDTVGGDAARDVLAERERQKQQEGWTAEHDDQYQDGELCCAAACYTMANDSAQYEESPNLWPWPEEWWKPTTERRNLVKAGALILAEIERLDRAAKPNADCSGDPANCPDNEGYGCACDPGNSGSGKP